MEVVLNRILSDAYPGSVQEILTDTELSRALEMMSWVEEPELEFYLAVDAAMYGPYILPEDICFYSRQGTGTEPWGTLGSYTFCFLLGLLTVLLTLALLLGGGLLLARQEQKSAPAAELQALRETVPPVAEETAPPAETEAFAAIPVETSPEKTEINAVPRYYQTDYPYIKFGNGTIATSGCSITCLAMVATYLTDQEYTPPQMAHHFGSYGKTNIERLDFGLEQMQLPYRRSENIQEVLQALRSGKVVIAMMDEESVFTAEQHFIVLAGMNDAGKFLVNDPMETNYIKADVHIRNAYDNGFEDYHLSRGFSGAWIFDKNDMPEAPFRFDASLPEQQENRYEGYTLTDDDTVRDVIYNTEFSRAVSTMNKWGEENFDPYIAVNTAMYGPYILPQDICFYSEWEKGQDIWGQLGKYTFARKR